MVLWPKMVLCCCLEDFSHSVLLSPVAYVILGAVNSDCHYYHLNCCEDSFGFPSLIMIFFFLIIVFVIIRDPVNKQDQ